MPNGMYMEENRINNTKVMQQQHLNCKYILIIAHVTRLPSLTSQVTRSTLSQTESDLVKSLRLN